MRSGTASKRGVGGGGTKENAVESRTSSKPWARRGKGPNVYLLEDHKSPRVKKGEWFILIVRGKKKKKRRKPKNQEQHWSWKRSSARGLFIFTKREEEGVPNKDILSSRGQQTGLGKKQKKNRLKQIGGGTMTCRWTARNPGGRQNRKQTQLIPKKKEETAVGEGGEGEKPRRHRKVCAKIGKKSKKKTNRPRTKNPKRKQARQTRKSGLGWGKRSDSSRLDISRESSTQKNKGREKRVINTGQALDTLQT